MAPSSAATTTITTTATSTTSSSKNTTPTAFDSATALLARAFVDDPAVRYLLNTLPEPDRVTYIHVLFGKLLTAARLNGGWVVAASVGGDDKKTTTLNNEDMDGAHSCAVFMPPGRKIDDNMLTMVRAGLLGLLWVLGVGGVWRLMTELGSVSDRAKARTFGTEQKYTYCFFVGTEKEYRGKGLSSSLLRAHQEYATSLGLPCWLEATTTHSRDVYARLGFEIVEEMVLGKGIAAADGRPEQGGEGVKIWAMVWWPLKVKA